MQAARVAAARSRGWRELRADRLERRGRLVIDTGNGFVYQAVRGTVWASGDPKNVLNELEVDAWMLVDYDVAFFARSKRTPTVADLDRLTERRQTRAAAARVKQEAQLRATPLRPVTLADTEGRRLPTVRQAAALILETGTITLKDQSLVFHLPAAKKFTQAQLDAVLVLRAAHEIVAPAVDSTSTKPLVERLPDTQVLADGGLLS
jgi:hypothetical protein